MAPANSASTHMAGEGHPGGPPVVPIGLVAVAGVLLAIGWGLYWMRRGRHRVSAED